MIIKTKTVVTLGAEHTVFKSPASTIPARSACLFSQLNVFRNRRRTSTFLFFFSSEYFQVQTRSAGPVESVLYVNEALRLLLPKNSGTSTGFSSIQVPA